MAKDKAAQRICAEIVLRDCGILPGDAFHILTSAQVLGLSDWAAFCNYRKPRNANGSRARCFHAYLIRAATS